jgi:hypothetical protein
MSLPPDIADYYGRGEEPERLTRGPEGQARADPHAGVARAPAAGTARGDLPFEDERFDAVLLLGASAHLPAAGRRSPPARQQAAWLGA